MAGFLTHFTNDQVLDHLFGARPVESRACLYFGLSSISANPMGEVDEPASPDYRRASVRNSMTVFGPSSGGRKTNAEPIRFPEPRSGWGLVRSVFVADRPSGGHVLAMADLDVPRMFFAGDVAPTIEPGALRLTHR